VALTAESVGFKVIFNLKLYKFYILLVLEKVVNT
jgi:hypothetical protein